MELDPEKHYCKFCNSTGLVSMIRDGFASSYAFRCICPNGDNPQNAHLQLWNGERNQIYKKTLYVYKWADFYGLSENRVDMPEPMPVSGTGTFIEKSQPKEAEVEDVPF